MTKRCMCLFPVAALLLAATLHAGQDIEVATQVELTGKNYTVLETGVAGDNLGIIVAVIPFAAASMTDAYNEMLEKVKRKHGDDFAIINVVQETTFRTWLVASFIKKTVRADVIRFTE